MLSSITPNQRINVFRVDENLTGSLSHLHWEKGQPQWLHVQKQDLSYKFGDLLDHGRSHLWVSYDPPEEFRDILHDRLIDLKPTLLEILRKASPSVKKGFGKFTKQLRDEHNSQALLDALNFLAENGFDEELRKVLVDPPF